MDSIKRALESIGRMWTALNATQRIILSVSASLMVLLLVWGSASSVQTMVRVAGPEVDAARRQSILSRLQERNQKHEIRGAEIFVPREDADRIVTELAGEGTMTSNAVWKFLEQSDIFATSWDKEKRYQIALQNRLEAMIRSVESVKNASVVINPGSTHSQLGFVGPKASASVQVELQDGKALSRKNIQAIAGLVARAVSGVEEDQVHIMDTRGNPYRVAKANSEARNADDIRELERNIEQDIYDKLKSAFVHYPSASFVVGVKVRKSSSETEEVKHDRPVVIESEENRILRKGGPSPSSGVRKGPDAEPSPESSSREDETSTQVKEKSVTSTKRTIERNPAGEIEKVRVGVLIPVEVGPDNKEMAEAEKVLSGLKEIAMSAAGPQAKTEDISVLLIPTKRPEPVAALATSDSPLVWLSLHASKIALFGLALAGLFVLLRVVQTVLARESVEEIQSLTAALTETQDVTAELAGAPAGDLGRLKQSVQDMVGRNPRSVADSLRSFMSGK